MPSVLFLCPHCEKHAEVQVTSVTRSRHCPHCGEPVLLQMGRKESKRRALLVGSAELPLGVTDKPLTPAYEPKSLEGEVLERMRMDPELRVFRNKVLAGVVTVAGAILAVVFADVWLKPALSETPSMVGTNEAGTEERSELLLGNHSPEVPKTEAAKMTVRRFFAAQSGEALLELVDDAQRWAAAIKRYVLMKPLKPLPVLSMTVEETGMAEDVMTIRSTLLSGEEVVLHLVWKGQMALVDWPSFSGWSALSWEELMKQAPHQAVTLRVLAARAEHFEGEFSDSGALICVKLLDPHRPVSPPLFAYALRESQEGVGIQSLLMKKQGKVTKLMIAVRYPANAASRDQVWIDHVVAEGWYQPACAQTAHVSGSLR